MKIRVSSNNFYVGNKQPVKDAQFLASLNCDISGIQEGHGGNAQDIKRTLAKTHVTYWATPKDKDKAFGMLDVPVVYKKSLKVYRHWARQISKRSQVKNIGMPRAATAVRFEKGGYDITFINTHCNAAVQGKDPKKTNLPLRIRRVSEYVAGMIVLERMIKNAQKRGDLVILVGDLNYHKTKAGVWRYSPQALFKRCNLQYREQHLDYIAFSRKFTASNKQVIGTNRTGSDHPWLVLDLEVIEKK